MKVKIGDVIYDGGVEPVMVILSDDDKENIRNMTPESKKYCHFPDTMTANEARIWMKTEEN
jgi:hypothetical protein